MDFEEENQYVEGEDKDAARLSDTIDVLDVLDYISSKLNVSDGIDGYQLMELIYSFLYSYKTDGVESLLNHHCIYEIPAGTTFYRAVSLKDQSIKKLTTLTPQELKKACGMGSDTTFCNSHPIENMTIRNEDAINNVMATLQTNRDITVFSFLPFQQIIGMQMKAGQTHDRGFFNECCRSDDFKRFLNENGYDAVVIIDQVDQYLRLPTESNTNLPGEWTGFYEDLTSEEDNNSRYLPDYAKPGPKRDDESKENYKKRQDAIKCLNEISESDMKNCHGYPVSDLRNNNGNETGIVYGTVYPEIVIKTDCIDILNMESFRRFYVKENLKSIARSVDFIPKMPQVKPFIKDGLIESTNLLILEDSLAKRTQHYNLRGYNTCILPHFVDPVTDFDILIHFMRMIDSLSQSDAPKEAWKGGKKTRRNQQNRKTKKSKRKRRRSIRK